MATTLLQKSGLKVFEQHMRQYEPADPVYETYTDKKGKQRRRRVRVLIVAFVSSSQQTDFRILVSIPISASSLQASLQETKRS